MNDQNKNEEEDKPILIDTLKGLINTIKQFSPQAFGDLSDKSLRICIDGKQVIEVSHIEVIPRVRDLTLLITTSSNIGFSGSVNEVIREELNSQPAEESLVEEREMITQEKLSNEFKAKIEDGTNKE